MAAIGERYFRLEIVGEAPKQRNHKVWICRCECGTEKIVRNDHLVKGSTRSCGCLYIKPKIKVSKPPTVKSLRERLESKIVKIPETGCWIWKGSGKIYGKIRSEGGRNSKDISAHRASYETYKGKIPTGLCVLHRCDTPKCVNPDHLFLGTHKDNTDDMMSKNRNSKYVPPPIRGEANHNSKISEKQAAEIYRSPETHRELAKTYGICKTTVGHIKNKRNWRHVNE